MESPSAYIPMDRRLAIASGETLAEYTQGAALFADISGFTPLTGALLKAYGPKRGAEELTRQLNLIFDVLVTEVHRYRGSVMAFSGDAITCWFEQDDGTRATACGLAMQQAMGQFTAIKTPSGGILSLAMKAAVATGPVRRFLVGDPKIQFIDALAGETLEQMAAAEHQADKGEVVVSSDVIEQIGDKLRVTDWRVEAETGHRYAAVSRFLDQDPMLTEATWPDIFPEVLTDNLLKAWLLPPVFERLHAGRGEFLAELRPAVVLFLYFGGIDYDRDDEAGKKLDAYVRWVQNVLIRYDAYPFQLTIGDKGSYLYTAFGAPIAHEDDAVRAISAAVELRMPPSELSFIKDIQIGISQGQIWTGAYGGTRRRTYGILGDDVNLSARLMQTAQPGQILVSQPAWHAAGNGFLGEQLPPFKVKGKTELITAISVSGVKLQGAIHLQEPKYALPMVGRESELAFVEDKMMEIFEGHGQIVALIAEAGMGKSRLVAETVRIANERSLVGYGGECQSYGTNIGYLVWQSIWRALFNLDPNWELDDQIRELEMQLELIDPSLLPRMPLLGAVLNLPIPDNELTSTFDAKLRKTSLESLLVDCLRAHAQITPLLFVLEDCHWLDPLSHDLLEVIGRAIVDLPVFIVMAFRPLQLERLKEARLEKLAYFHEIHLADFTPDEAERLINLKLEQFFGAHTDVPTALLQRITDRAQGNPFYIEELLNYLQDQHFDPQNLETLAQLDLPASLHSLILSRIDQLTEHQKSTIKVASVIGRLFEAAWLWGMYPDLGEPEQIKADLEMLHGLDLAPMDKPEPELTYLFKHIVTQEVAYESLPYAMRAMLHDQLGQYIERTYQKRLDRYVELLAFHYGRSENEAKKREYLRKAGEAAQAEYNNEAAIDYFQRVLPLLPSEEQVPVMLKLGKILHLVGHWDEANDLHQKILVLTEQLDDRPSRAQCQTALGDLLREQSRYSEAAKWFARARVTFEALGDLAGIGDVTRQEGKLAWASGDWEAAKLAQEKSLEIARQLDDQPNIGNALNNLAVLTWEQGDYELARKLNGEALEVRYKLTDKAAISTSLNNLGLVAIEEGNYEEARTQLEVALGLEREVGDRWGIANALHSLATATQAQKDYEAALALYKEGLSIAKQLGDGRLIALLLGDMGGLAALQERAERALKLTGAASALREFIGAALAPLDQTKLERLLEPIRQKLGNTVADAAMAEGKAMSMEEAIDYALEV